MSALLIRLMTAEDIPAVGAVDRLCIRPPWSQQTFAAEISSSANYYLVALVGEEIAGYIGGSILLDEAHVTTFGVHPDQRRQHIGERLFLALLTEMMRRKVKRITLEVREGNTAARALYERYGFIALSRRKRYYADNDEDAIVMWVEDTSRYAFHEALADGLERMKAEG